MALRSARILSSCNDASNSQKQRMNVNINIDEKTTPIPVQQQPQQIYPNVSPVNFTTMEQQVPEQSTYPSVAPNLVTRNVDLDDSLAKDSLIADLETKNKFLNLLLTVFQSNPLYINSYVVCNAQMLMEMIRILTKCDKVDLVLNDDIACTSCCSGDKLIYVSKILVTKGDKTEDLKYGFNDVYSKFISYGISLKIVC
ncbi:MAG: hypothetical protein HDQ88_06795 [Clostridia bacterium]|nr:hypothetical protein [Clostridia bacterium]